LKELNQTATVTFIQTSDISLLNNANAVAAEIKAKESHLNLLVMSQGQMTFQGRDETSEGLDRKLSTHYYSRALLTTAFLPLLQEASNDVLGSRVISVFSPGSEGPVLEDDFELKTGFSLSQAAKQAASFNSFMMETLSQKYPNVGFLHVYPSIVMTGLDRELPRWIKLVTTPFATLASVNIDDSGEGFVYLATDDKWKTGLALVDWKGADRDTRRVKKCEISGGGSWWDEKLGERVWTHTEQVFERIVGKVA
jgi:NAD(P)-dependent dehydrogenase (short-subunit alcohol dehydrogenase family)